MKAQKKVASRTMIMNNLSTKACARFPFIILFLPFLISYTFHQLLMLYFLIFSPFSFFTFFFISCYCCHTLSHTHAFIICVIHESRIIIFRIIINIIHTHTHTHIYTTHNRDVLCASHSHLPDGIFSLLMHICGNLI